MKKRNLLLSVFTVFILWQCLPEKVDIYMIGDSTMANKKPEKKPETGWGQVFDEFFNSDVTVHNHSVNGRSSKSFIDEGRWQTVMDSLKPGNWVFIQFGHNDQKSHDSTRYTKPHEGYKANLQRYVNDSRKKGAKPVLLTPVMRRRFDENNVFYDTHGEYPDVVREVAKEMNVPLIDVHKSSRKMIEELGVEKTKEVFLWVKPGEYEGYPHGKEDNTHFTKYGAHIIACLVAKDLSKLNLELSKYLIDTGQNCY